jgi:hypothetical protein
VRPGIVNVGAASLEMCGTSSSFGRITNRR